MHYVDQLLCVPIIATLSSDILHGFDASRQSKQLAYTPQGLLNSGNMCFIHSVCFAVNPVVLCLTMVGVMLRFYHVHSCTSHRSGVSHLKTYESVGLIASSGLAHPRFFNHWLPVHRWQIWPWQCGQNCLMQQVKALWLPACM